MAEEKLSDKSSQTGTTLFRLPRFFTQGAEADDDELTEDEASEEAGASSAPVASVAPASSAPSGGSQSGGAPMSGGAFAGVLMSELASMREEVERLSDQITQVNEREGSLERVFDALHEELAGYKNDFLYEHLKPVVRPLLFLFDSIEQFDSEVAMTDTGATEGNADNVLSPQNVRSNVGYFRDQLVEALRVCEVTIMEAPNGPFNAKFQKAVDIMPVPAEQDNLIVRVVRSGWYLNGQLLRPAEVVVGKFRG